MNPLSQILQKLSATDVHFANLTAKADQQQFTELRLAHEHNKSQNCASMLSMPLQSKFQKKKKSDSKVHLLQQELRMQKVILENQMTVLKNQKTVNNFEGTEGTTWQSGRKTSSICQHYSRW